MTTETQTEKITDTFRETTIPLIRPSQIQDMEDEREDINYVLNAPPHIASQIKNRSFMVKQLKNLERQLENYKPKPYGPSLIDHARKREEELRIEFTTGMPTQAEMRRAPAGAVDKHRAWSKRNKQKILEWKNVRLRLHASGALPEYPDDSSDIANAEQYRPSTGSMNMDNTMIPGKVFSSPVYPQTVVFTDEERQMIEEYDSSIARSLALLPADVRKELKETISGIAKNYMEAGKPESEQ